MLCTSLQFPRRGLRRVAAPARRLPRRFDDGDPARAPVGQPAEPLEYRRRPQARRPRGLEISDDGKGLPIHGNLRAAPFAIQHLEPGRLHARFDYGAHPDELAAFPFPHTVEVDARLDERGLAPHDRSSCPTGDRRGTDLVLLAPVPAVAERSSAPIGSLRGPRASTSRSMSTSSRRAPAPRSRPRPRRSASRTFDDHYALGRDRHVLRRGRRTRRCASLRRQLSVRPAVRARRAGEFIAIEPMTATDRRARRRDDTDVRARRPVPRVVLDRLRRVTRAAAVAAGRVHRVPRRPLCAGRPLLGAAALRRRSSACRIRAAPTGRACTSRASAMWSCLSHAEIPYDAAPCTVHGVPPAGSRQRRAASRCGAEQRHRRPGRTRRRRAPRPRHRCRRALHGWSRPYRDGARRRARAARPRARRRRRLPPPRRRRSRAAGLAGVRVAGRRRARDAAQGMSMRSTAGRPNADPRNCAAPNENTEPSAPST